MGRYKKLLSNTAILAIGTFASKFLVFFMMPLYTRYLLPEEYSTADLISQTANLLIPLACAGIADGIFRFALDKSEDKKSVFSSGLTVLVAVYVIYNRGFTRRGVEIDMLPDDWDHERRVRFVEDGKKRYKRSKWMLTLIIGFLLTFLIDALELFLVNLF